VVFRHPWLSPSPPHSPAGHHLDFDFGHKSFVLPKIKFIKHHEKEDKHHDEEEEDDKEECCDKCDKCDWYDHECCDDCDKCDKEEVSAEGRRQLSAPSSACQQDSLDSS
jgi:hypothetical protein